MARAQAALLVAAVLALGPGSLEAQRKPGPAKGTVQKGSGKAKLKVRPGQGEEASPPESAYGGVDLHGGGEPPETSPPPAGLQAVTWPGFRATASGSEVFLQLTGQVTYAQQIKGRRILITLDRTIVPLRNNLRPVITRNFQSPVASFRLRPLGKDKVRLEISLRRKTEPSISQSSRGKFTFLVVAFPGVAASAE